MNRNPIPDEITVRRTIAECARELRLLRTVERALARHRREREKADLIRETFDAPQTTSNAEGGKRG